jgi:hypothetical protein
MQLAQTTDVLLLLGPLAVDLREIRRDWLLARRRGHDDVGVGTLIGSNLFNGLAVAGLMTTRAAF